MKKGIDKVIKNKLQVWIFPEGTRNRFSNEVLLPFKKGAFYFATSSKLPVIPVCISTYKNNLNFKRFHAGKIIVEVLDPIHHENFVSSNELMVFAQNAMTEKITLLNKELAKAL